VRVLFTVLILALVACGLLIGSPSAAEAQPPPPAPRPRPPATRNAAPTRVEESLQPTLEVALDAQPEAPAAFDATSAYLPLKGGRLVAIDIVSGRVRWTGELGTKWAPSVDAGLVVVAGDDLLTALDAATGRPMWRVPMTGGFSAPPIALGGWIVAAPASGDVVAIRATDGHVLWTYRLGAPVRVRPVIAPTGVYVSLADGRVVALDLATGMPRWERHLDGNPADLLVLDDRLFVGADDKHFYSLKTSDGSQRWRRRIGGRPAGPAAVDARRVYYVALDNILWALDINNGGLKWHQPLPVRPSGGPLVVGDVVIVAGVAAEVHAYRTQTGAPAGKSESPADLASAPQLVPADVPALTSVAMVTRGGVFMLLTRRIEPIATPLPYPLGTEIPLSRLGVD
jgi:outer membrane protein assembly factor BamB